MSFCCTHCPLHLHTLQLCPPWPPHWHLPSFAFRILPMQIIRSNKACFPWFQTYMRRRHRFEWFHETVLYLVCPDSAYRVHVATLESACQMPFCPYTHNYHRSHRGIQRPNHEACIASKGLAYRPNQVAVWVGCKSFRRPPHQNPDPQVRPSPPLVPAKKKKEVRLVVQQLDNSINKYLQDALCLSMLAFVQHWIYFPL